MRYLVVLFGLAGLAATGFVAYQFGTDWLAYYEAEKVRFYELVENERKVYEKEQDQLKTPAGSRSADYVNGMLLERNKRSVLKTWPTDPLAAKYIVGDMEDYNEKYQAFYNIQRALPFLLSGLFLGLIGIFVSYDGNGYSGAALLIVGGAVPGLFFPRLLIATGLLVLAGLCALLIRPRRRKEPKPVIV